MFLSTGAVVAVFTFLLATNYCVCEAFTGDHAHAESSHHHASAGYHDEQTPTSQDQHDVCCSTLQAVISSSGTLQVASLTPTGLLPFVLSLSSKSTPRAQVAAVLSGLSPPTQVPPPRLPFYRTTFANHAPPVHLA